MLAIVLQTLPSSPASGLDLLLSLSLKATVVLAGAALVTLALHRASAAARHLLWSAGLLGTLALPVLALWGPSWSVRGLDLPTLARRAPAATAPPIARTETAQPAPAPAAGLASPTPAPEAAPTARPIVPPAPPRQPLDLAAVVLTLWAAGAAAVLGWLLLGAWMLGRITRRARAVSDPGWLDLVRDCAQQLGIRRPIHLATSDRVAVPCAWGALQPQVLIPAVADSWSADRRRAVLLHELAHIARRDCLVQTLVQVACAMLWFHPLAWVASWRIRIERERACDDLVLGADTSATDYADHLLAVVRSLRQRRLTAIGEVAFARPSQLEGRLLAVLDPDQRRGALTAGRAWMAGLAAALMVLPLGALRPWSESAQAGMTLTDARQARPEDAAASRLMRTPDIAADFSTRMNWAMDQGARQSTGYWVAYAIAHSGDTEGNLSDSGPIEIQTLNKRWPGARMADVLAGRSMRDAKVVPNNDVMVLAFHYAARSDRPEQVDRIRVQSEELTAAFGRQPLFWLGEVEDHESLHWVEKLESGLRDPELRSAALHAIACHADGEAVRAHMVTVARSDAPAEVRASAVERMVRFPDGETIDFLVGTAHDDRDHEVRTSAIEALGNMHSDKATRALSRLARDPHESSELRRDAIEALGGKASAEAEQTLDDLVAADPTPEPGKAAKKKDKDGSMTMFEGSTTLITPTPGGQDITVLDEQGRPEVTIKQHKGKQKSETHVQSGQADQEDPVGQEEVQRQAVESLARLPEATSVPKLIKIGRTHPNVSVRRAAVAELGNIEGSKALDGLMEFAWADNDEEVAREAVNALENRAGSLPRIIELARKHKSTAVRRQAVSALGQANKPEAIRALDDLVGDDSDQEVQREAVNAIAELPEETSLPRLERIARSHPRVAVRRQAIDALGNFDPDKVAPILESLIGHEGKKSH